MTRRSVFSPVIPIVTAFLVLSCGGGGNKGIQDVSYDGPWVDVTAGPDSTQPGPDVSDEPRPEDWCEIIPLHDISAPLTVNVGGSITIHVKVIDHMQNAPAPNVAVAYEIVEVTDLLGNPAQGDAQLEASIAYTDEYGLIHNTFSAGTVGDLEYKVELTADCGEPVTLDIIVTDSPCGCIKVELSYEGELDPSALHDIKVHVLPSDYTCDKLHAEKDVPPSIGDKTIMDLYGTTQFDCVPSGNYYTVYAKAKGPKFEGQEVACVVSDGCDDGVFVQPDKCRKVKLPLYLVTLNPTGCYDSVDKFDLSKVIEDCAGGDTTLVECATNTGQVGQQICCVINEVETFFTNPGETIVETIVEIAKQFLPTIIVDAVANIFKDAVAKIVTDLIFNNAPDFIKDFFTIGQDMVGIITHPELQSDLCLSKLQTNFSIQGTHYYTGIVLYWKIGCDPSAPDYDTCGKLVFDMEDLQNTQFPINIIEGKFTSTIADFNRLIVDPHAIALNYGKLVLFVLNEVLIAGITGGQAHSVLEAAKLWIDCEALADGVIGEVVGLIPGLDKSDVEDVCNSAIDFLLLPVDLFLGSLTLDSNITLQGSGTMVDETCDLKVDSIINGIWNGQIQTSKSAQSSVTGTWEAYKQ